MEYRSCGCQVGRPCDCGMLDTEISHLARECGVCENCTKNEEYRKLYNRPGKFRCKFLKTVKQYELEKTHTKIIFGFKKEFEVWVPNTLLVISNRKKIRKPYYINLIGYREAYKIFRNNLTTELNNKETELLKRGIELKELSSNIHVMQHHELVDSTILHDSYQQRIDVHQACKLLTESVAVLEEEVAAIKDKLLKSKEFVYNVAIIPIQSLCRLLPTKDLLRKIRKEVYIRRASKAATIIQGGWKIHQAKKVLNELKTEAYIKLIHDCATDVERVFRGHLGRKRARARRKHLEDVKNNQAACKIQSVWRGKKARVEVVEIKIEIKKQEIAKKEANFDDAATNIQRVYRGRLARRKVKNKRLMMSLNPKAKQLADMYIVNGNFWEFMKEVSDKFNQYEEREKSEVEDANAFIQGVVKLRKEEEERNWDEWEDVKLQMSNTIENATQQPVDDTDSYRNTTFDDTTILYNQKVQPKSKIAKAITKSKVKKIVKRSKNKLLPIPRELLHSSLDKYIIDGNLSKTFSNTSKEGGVEVTTYERHKNINNKSVVQTLDNKDSMNNISLATFFDEMNNISNNNAKESISFPSSNVWHDIPGSESDISYLILHAVLRDYIPSNSKSKTGQQAFKEFISLPTNLYKVRWEQQAREIATPYIKILLDKGCTTISSLSKCQLESLNIPKKIIKQIRQLVDNVLTSEKLVTPKDILQTSSNRGKGSNGVSPSQAEDQEDNIGDSRKNAQHGKEDFNGDDRAGNSSINTLNMMNRPTTVNTVRYNSRNTSRVGTSVTNRPEDSSNRNTKSPIDKPYRPDTGVTAIYGNLPQSRQSYLLESRGYLQTRDGSVSRSNNRSSKREIHSRLSMKFSHEDNNSNITNDALYSRGTLFTRGSESMMENREHDDVRDGSIFNVNEIQEDNNGSNNYPTPSLLIASPDATINNKEDNNTIGDNIPSRDEDEQIVNNDNTDSHSLSILLCNKLTSDYNITSLMDPIHEIITHAAIRNFPGNNNETSNEENFQYFIKKILSIQDSDENYLRKLIKERYRDIKKYIEPFVNTLEEKGYTTIGSLIACPLQSLGLPLELVSSIRGTLERQMKSKPELVSESNKTFDRRYSRSKTDPSRPYSPSKPRYSKQIVTLPPVVPSVIKEDNRTKFSNNDNAAANWDVIRRKDSIHGGKDANIGTIDSDSILSSVLYPERFYCTHPDCLEHFGRKYTLLIHLRTHEFAKEYHWNKNTPKIK